MSTKTSFKRIALVAVASLGLGVLTSVSAVAGPITALDASVTNASGTVTAPVAAGSSVTADLNTVVTGDAAAATTAVYTWTLLDPNGTDVTSSATITAAPATGITSAAVGGTAAAPTSTVVITNGTVAGTYKVATLSYTAASAGRYTVRYARAASTGTVVAALTIADATTPYIYVYGSGSVVSSSGIGTTTIGAVAGGIAKVRFATDSHANSTVYNLTSSGVGTIQTIEDGTTAPASKPGIAGATDFTQGVKVTTGANGNLNDVIATVASNVAGTQTLTWTKIDAATGNPTVVATQAITWGAAPALSVATSKVFISAGNDTSANSADDTVLVSKTPASAGAIVANIQVELKDGNGNALNGQKLNVTLNGPGLIVGETGTSFANINGTTTAGARTYSDGSGAAANFWQFGIAADGTAGRLDVTISVGTTVLAVKTMNFFGSIAKLTATNNLIAVANGSTSTDVVNVCATDSNGNAVPGAVIFATSADSTIASVAASATAHASSTAVTEDYDTTDTNAVVTATGFNPLLNTSYRSAKANGCAGFSVTAASQTVKDSVVLTFRDAALAADATASTTSTVNVGGKSAATVTISSDKASYAAGAKGTITLTFKDSTGRLVGAGAGTGTLTGALTSSASLQGAALFAADNNTKLGVVTADVFFPYYAGTVVITGTTGTNSTFLDSAARSASLSQSIKVAAPADSTSAQIASLIKKINDLSKLIAKIQKKLGVK